MPQDSYDLSASLANFCSTKYAARAGLNAETDCRFVGGTFYVPQGSPTPDPGGQDAPAAVPTAPTTAEFDAVENETATTDEVRKVLAWALKRGMIGRT